MRWTTSIGHLGAGSLLLLFLACCSGSDSDEMEFRQAITEYLDHSPAQVGPSVELGPRYPYESTIPDVPWWWHSPRLSAPWRPAHETSFPLGGKDELRKALEETGRDGAGMVGWVGWNPLFLSHPDFMLHVEQEGQSLVLHRCPGKERVLTIAEVVRDEQVATANVNFTTAAEPAGPLPFEEALERHLGPANCGHWIIERRAELEMYEGKWRVHKMYEESRATAEKPPGEASPPAEPGPAREIRDGVAEMVDEIRVAERAYQSTFGAFVPVEPWPRAILEVGKGAVEVDRAQIEASTYWKIGWEPSGPLHGVYWVEVSPDGNDMAVHGILDADGDGVPAHFVSTDDEVMLVTGLREF